MRGWKKRRAGKVLAVLLAVAMLCTMQGMPVLAETVSNEQKLQGGAASGSGGAAALMLKNPVHHCSKEDIEKDTTDWSYIYFGSYPQTEVMGDALTAAITGASYDNNGDAWVGSTKYRRISKSDTNNISNFGNSMYRYFKWERIKWRVLNVNSSTIFVVADKGLDCKCYNNVNTSIIWENCEFRNWLNNDFYGAAFSSNEQIAIMSQTVVNEDNSPWGTEGGNDTWDKVFLLSIGEVKNPAYGFCKQTSGLGGNSASRWMQVSDYAHRRGVKTYSDSYTGGTCFWWLRSPGSNTHRATVVNYYGNISSGGFDVSDSYDACVPALHINLSSDLWSITDDGTSGEGGNGGEVTDPDPSDGTIQCASSQILEKGQTKEIIVRAYEDDPVKLEQATSSVKWQSENPSIATVSGGTFQDKMIEQEHGTDESYMVWTKMTTVKVTGVSEGTTTITGTAADGSVARCKITVEPDSDEAAGGSGNGSGGGSLTLGADMFGGAPGIGDFFPDSWEFKSPMFPIEFSKEEDKDGSYKLKGTIGIGRSDLLDNKTEWNQYKKILDDVDKTGDTMVALSKKLKDIRIKKAGVAQVKESQKKAELSLVGYIECSFDKNGNLISQTGKIVPSMKWKLSKNRQFWTSVGPLYLNLEGSAKLSGEAGPKYDYKTKSVSLANGKLQFTPAITLEGGYGVNKIATIGAQGKASFPITVVPIFKGELNASASVHLKLVFVIDHTWKLATFKKVFWDSSARNAQAVDAVGSFFDEGTLSAIDTSFTKYESAWNGSTRSSDETIDATGSEENTSVNETMLMDGILPSSLPMQAELNGKRVLVFQSYDSARNTLDSSVLNYSVYENGVWSAPQPVWDNGCNDMFADMKVVNNKLVLAWQKAKAEVTGDITRDGEGVLEEMAKNSEICFAIFDEASGTFTNQTYVTNNELCDTMPRICNNSDDIIISWVRNDAADMMQETGNNTIYTATWNGDSFETEETLIQSFGTIEEFITYQDGDAVKAVYASQIGEGEEKANIILNGENNVLESLPELVSDASNGTVTEMRYEDGNVDFLLNGTIYRYHTSDGTVDSFLAGESTFGNTAKYCSNGEKSGYIWSVYDEETDTDKIIASMASADGYCEPVTLYEKTGVIWRYISPILNEDGSWAFLANAMQTAEGQDNHNSLIYVEKQPETGVALAGAFINMYDAKDDLTGVDYYVQNTGDSIIHELCLDVTMADGTVRTQKIPITLYPGESAAETAYIDLTDVDSAQDISVAIYEQDQPGKEDCVVTATVGQADIEVLGTAEESGDTVTITAELKNNSRIHANTTLSLYSDETCTKTLCTPQKAAVAENGSQKVQFQISKKDVVYNENNAAYLTLKASVEGGDYKEDNNISYVILYNPKADSTNQPATEGSKPGSSTQTSGVQKTSFAKANVTLKKTSYTYDGKAKKPAVTVKIGSKKLVKNKDYKLAYKNNKKVGTASVTITGIGTYTGSLKKTFKIVPKGTTISGKPAAKSKGFTIKWKKQASVTGYQIQYSTSKKFKKKTTVTKTIKKKSTVKFTANKLKANKKYYIRIRTYQTVKGKKYESAWSKAKTVKTKK